MLETLLIVLLVILAVIMVGVILLQPDRSQGMAKSMNMADVEKEGIEKFTEITNWSLRLKRNFLDYT